MSKLPVSKNDKERVEKLISYEIMDTLPEDQFDDLTKLAAQICDVPICLISLVDDKRQWFKSKVGLGADETPREISFCQYAIMDDKIFEVENAEDDIRFQKNPLVTGDPNIRFYAGAPLKDEEGLNMGTLCVIDEKPKTLTKDQRIALQRIANTAIRMIEYRKKSIQEEKYSKFFEMSLDMSCIAGLDGFFVELNPAFTKTLGWSEKELKSKPVFDFIHPDDIETTKNEFGRLAEGALTIGFENRYKNKGGGYTWMHWTCQPDAKTGELYAVAHDITVLKGALDSVKKASLAKDAFLSNMSHEMRTPLNAIIGFSDLLQQSTLDHKQKGFLDIVTIASNNLLILINDVLDISKFQSGKIELEKRRFDLKKAINNVIKLQSGVAKSKGIKLLVSMDHEIPDFVKGDGTRLMQILVNLTNNAVKFTEKGYVEIKAFASELKEDKVKISFIIKDTGIGIPEDKLNLVFDRFQQAEDSTTRKYGGTGLGLNIVKTLLELHDSKIELQSTVGQGSEFSFDMIYELSNEKNSIEENREIINNNHQVLSGVKILLVEDNEHNILLASNYLKKHGALIDVAENGLIGVNKLKENKNYDLVLMDLQMPVMDGYEASKIIRKEVDAKIPIIACSAHSLPKEQEECFKIGVNDYVTKPYSENELINAIYSLVDTASIVDKTTNSEEAVEDIEIDDLQAVIKSYVDNGEQEFILGMLEIFNKRIQKDIDGIQSAIESKNVEDLKKLSHLLLGSFSSIELEKGMHIAKEAELASNHNDEQLSIQKAKHLYNYLIKLKVEIEKVDLHENI